jgi:hypothetical protein
MHVSLCIAVASRVMQGERAGEADLADIAAVRNGFATF